MGKAISPGTDRLDRLDRLDPRPTRSAMSQPPHLTRRHRPADEVALDVEATRGVRQVGVVVVPAPGRARRPDGVRPLPLAESNNHNPHANTAWLAGGGVRGGVSYGETDAFG